MKMNKTMLLGEVANRSGIPADECGVVLKTFERVLCEELTRKLYRYGGWILLLIGLFISAFAFGQISDRKGRPVQTIRGMVVDGDSKYPIPYATVRLSDKEGMGTTTDSLGRFTIPQVPVGRHTVEAAFMGYEPGIFREILVTSAKEVYLEIPLKESLQMLRCIHFTGVLDNDRSFSGIWIHECNPSLWRQCGHILSSTDSFIALHFHIFSLP